MTHEFTPNMTNLRHSYINCHLLSCHVQPKIDKELDAEFDRAIAIHNTLIRAELCHNKVTSQQPVVTTERQSCLNEECVS